MLLVCLSCYWACLYSVEKLDDFFTQAQETAEKPLGKCSRTYVFFVYVAKVVFCKVGCDCTFLVKRYMSKNLWDL